MATIKFNPTSASPNPKTLLRNIFSPPFFKGGVRGGFVLFLFLSLARSAFASTFSLSPSSGSFKQGCSSSVNIVLDAGGSATNAADIIVDYDPSLIDVTAISNGSVYTNYFGNVIDSTNGILRLTGATFSGTFTSSGTFATIVFKPKTSSGSGYFNIRFTGANPYNTLDSNIADASTSNDNLTSVQNGSYTFTSGSCQNDTIPPTIAFISPTNGQTGVPADASIQVEITDNGSGVDLSNVSVVINGVSYTSSSSRVTVTGTSADYIITVKPADSLFTDQTDSVLVKAADLSSNSKQSSINFNTPVTSTPTPTASPTTALTPTPLPTGYVYITTTPAVTVTSFVCPTPPSCSSAEVPSFVSQNDKTSPTIEFIQPKNKDTIDPSTNIIIKVSDLESGINLRSFKIGIGQSIFTADDRQVTYQGSLATYQFALHLDQPLQPATDYVIQATVVDQSGNGLTRSISIRTTTPLTTQISNFFYPTSTKTGSSSTTSSSSSPNFLTYIIFIIAIAYLGWYLLHLPDLHAVPFGIVCNSQTNEPLAGVKINFFDDKNKKVAAVTTNVFGIFASRLASGRYRLSAELKNFRFPATSSEKTLNFPHQYHGQTVSLKPLSSYLTLPLDPIAPTPVRFFQPTYGIVSDAQHQPLAHHHLGLRETKFNTLIATRITDVLGRYRFLVPHGHYEVISLDSQDKILLTVDTRHLVGGYTVINQPLTV